MGQGKDKMLKKLFGCEFIFNDNENCGKCTSLNDNKHYCNKYNIELEFDEDKIFRCRICLGCEKIFNRLAGGTDNVDKWKGDIGNMSTRLIRTFDIDCDEIFCGKCEYFHSIVEEDSDKKECCCMAFYEEKIVMDEDMNMSIRCATCLQAEKSFNKAFNSVMG